MTSTDLSDDDRQELASYEARLARPICSPVDITDELTQVLAETALANRALNKPRRPRPRSAYVETERPDLRLEHEYGIGNGLDDFEDRQRQLKTTLTALVQRGRADVTTAVKILSVAKTEALNLSVQRLLENPRLRRARVTIRRDLERSAKQALAFLGKASPGVRESPWTALYRDILVAVEHDPFLNPQSSRRRRGETRHQELLTKTGTQLRKVGVSKADTKTLLQATGLIELLKAKRR